MKWTNEQVEQLKERCYADTSNAELAKEFGVSLADIHAKRSALGITVPKCKAGRPVEKQTREKVLEEINRVELARTDAAKKIGRCTERLAELYAELNKLEEKK